MNRRIKKKHDSLRTTGKHGFLNHYKKFLKDIGLWNENCRSQIEKAWR